MAALVTLLLTPHAFAQTPNALIRPPQHILWLMTDQHRYDGFGFAGDPHAKTPALDRLAAQGIYCPGTYCAFPLCVPSRTSMLLGRYTHATGVLNNRAGADRNALSFPQLLRQSGYRTACFGKLHVKGRDELDWDVYAYDTGKYGAEDNRAAGKPSVYPQEQHQEWIAKEQTLAYIKAHRSERWFLQCSFIKPHPPSTASATTVTPAHNMNLVLRCIGHGQLLFLRVHGTRFPAVSAESQALVLQVLQCCSVVSPPAAATAWRLAK